MRRRVQRRAARLEGRLFVAVARALPPALRYRTSKERRPGAGLDACSCRPAIVYLASSVRRTTLAERALRDTVGLTEHLPDARPIGPEQEANREPGSSARPATPDPAKGIASRAPRSAARQSMFGQRSGRTVVLAEVRTGFEPAYNGFANRCLTTWLPHRLFEAAGGHASFLPSCQRFRHTDLILCSRATSADSTPPLAAAPWSSRPRSASSLGPAPPSPAAHPPPALAPGIPLPAPAPASR